MKIKCRWKCKYNKDGFCKQPIGLYLELSSSGYFTCNKMMDPRDRQK